MLHILVLSTTSLGTKVAQNIKQQNSSISRNYKENREDRRFPEDGDDREDIAEGGIETGWRNGKGLAEAKWRRRNQNGQAYSALAAACRPLEVVDREELPLRRTTPCRCLYICNLQHNWNNQGAREEGIMLEEGKNVREPQLLYLVW